MNNSDISIAVNEQTRSGDIDGSWGTVRTCYINFAEHLLNAFNPNMTLPGLPYRWTDEDWRNFLRMIRGFGYNEFEFWLTPRLFSREGLESAWGREFARQMQANIEFASEIGLSIKMLCILSTVGDGWHTHCPNVAQEWNEVRYLWDQWTKTLRRLGVICIFPGDPGGCSRNGCTAETYIDRSLEICEVIQRNQPAATIELGTWGNPIWGWGNIQGPSGWDGRFIQQMQPTAWRFDSGRADRTMRHLLKRLPDFPENLRVAINLGFNSDGDPDAADGQQDARAWVRLIAKIRPIVTWDMSLCEGENAVIPHYRFQRLFAQRRREREAAPYSGGICFTMTPLLNQLSLFQSAQSFANPDADSQALSKQFYVRLFGRNAEALPDLLPCFEVIPDWGNYERPDLTRPQLHRTTRELIDLLESLGGCADESIPFHPHPEEYRQSLLFFANLFQDLSGPSPDYSDLSQRYWNRVYSIYDHLPSHVDPRPRVATEKIINWFKSQTAEEGELIPGKWS